MSGISNTNAVIPRNYGLGPGSFITNLNLSKTFGLGKGKPAATTTASAAKGSAAGGPQAVAKGGGAGGGPVVMVMGPGGPSGETPKPYQLTFGVSAQNLFNKVNLSNPISTLSSPSFGQVRSANSGFGFFGGGGSANRRVDLSVRFSF